MEGFYTHVDTKERAQETTEARVHRHAKEFDEQISKNRLYSPEDIEQAWKSEIWNIEGAEVRAIGVEHVPETLITHRKDIESAIKDSDVVINEFAPEAQGIYNSSVASILLKIPYEFDAGFNLEDLREEYLRNERTYNIGMFHHEVELTAAMYGKDMSCMDLTLTKDPRDFFQTAQYLEGAYKAKRNRALLEKAGMGIGSVALASASADLLKKTKLQDVSRRNFLRGSLAAGGVLAGAAIVKSMPDAKKVSRVETEESNKFGLDKNNRLRVLEELRNANIALGIRRLIEEKGYKKIALIYGSEHIESVGNLLQIENLLHLTPEQQSTIEKEKAFRIYRLVKGKNNSERFMASPDLVWNRID